MAIMSREIRLIRHAESEVNLDAAETYRGANVWSELTELGKSQARELGRTWNNQGIHPQRWLCSPAIRAQQTCRYCQNQLGISWPRFEVAADLVELRQGEAEGETRSSFVYAIGGKREPLTAGHSDDDWWRARLCSTNLEPVRGAETQEEVYQRARRAIEAWLGGIESSDGQCLAIVTHENVIKCLLRGLKLTTKSFSAIRVGHASAIQLRWSAPDEWRGDLSEQLG
jgi:broad specificity phosphatase PhoE